MMIGTIDPAITPSIMPSPILVSAMSLAAFRI